MGKVEVWRSIGRAYGFGFGQFGTALAICWLPYVMILAVAYFLFVPAMGDFFRDIASSIPQFKGDMDEAERQQFVMQFLVTYADLFRRLVLFGVLYLFLRAMVAIGLTRASIGLDGTGFFYFSLGAPVWKLFGAWLATYLILYAAKVLLTIFVVMIGAVVAVALIKFSIPAAIGLVALLCFAAVCALIYISVRLNFFLPPVIVSEKKLDILRSWTLSEGNFWRIFAIYVVICLPFVIFISAVDCAVFITLLPHLPAVTSNVFTVHTFDWTPLAQGAERLLPWLPAFLAIAFLTDVLFAAMHNAAKARAYRGLVATDIASQTED